MYFALIYLSIVYLYVKFFIDWSSFKGGKGYYSSRYFRQVEMYINKQKNNTAFVLLDTEPSSVILSQT